MKLLIDETNIMIILTNIAGAIIRFALAIVFMLNLLQIILVTMKNKLIYRIGEF